MIDGKLLAIMCCPETHQVLKLAEPAVLARLNEQIASGSLRNRAGAVVQERIEGGLVREDGQVLYPIRRGLPIMLIDESLGLNPPG